MPHFEGPKQNKNMVLVRDGVKKMVKLVTSSKKVGGG